MGGTYDRSKYLTGRIVACVVCGKEKYLSLAELKKNKTGRFYCSKTCLDLDYKGERNPNFNHHWASELKESQSVKIKTQYRNGRKVWNKGLDKSDPRVAKNVSHYVGNNYGHYTKGQKRIDDVWRNVFNSAGLRYGLQREHKYKYHAEFWLQLREQVLKRDDYTCQICGKQGTLIAHHIIPVRLSGEDELENLIALCRKCHGREEPKSRKRATLLRD